MKHTPGPWFLSPDEHEDEPFNGAWNITVPNRTIASVAPYDFADDTNEANARLIAAAPEMLEALKDALAYFSDREDADHNGRTFVGNEEMRLATALRAAIAKASGTQS